MPAHGGMNHENHNVAAQSVAQGTERDTGKVTTSTETTGGNIAIIIKTRKLSRGGIYRTKIASGGAPGETICRRDCIGGHMVPLGKRSKLVVDILYFEGYWQECPCARKRAWS